MIGFKPVISYDTIKRLPQYYQIVMKLNDQGRPFVSAQTLAEKLNTNAVVIRKDLASIGLSASMDAGYDVDTLIQTISQIMNYANLHDAFVVGMGPLGQALINYKGFNDIGLEVVAGFDETVDVLPAKVQNKPVFAISELERLAKRLHVQTAILAVPDDKAQQVAEQLIKSGITGLLNYTAVDLVVPDNILVQKIDLAREGAVILDKRQQDTK